MISFFSLQYTPMSATVDIVCWHLLRFYSNLLGTWKQQLLLVRKNGRSGFKFIGSPAGLQYLHLGVKLGDTINLVNETLGVFIFLSYSFEVYIITFLVYTLVTTFFVTEIYLEKYLMAIGVSGESVVFMWSAIHTTVQA